MTLVEFVPRFEAELASRGVGGRLLFRICGCIQSGCVGAEDPQRKQAIAEQGVLQVVQFLRAGQCMQHPG